MRVGAGAGRRADARDRFVVTGSNETRRKRLARALSERAGVSYQAARRVVDEEGDQGRLPEGFDRDGLEAALLVCLERMQLRPCPRDLLPDELLAYDLRRYVRLAEVAGGEPWLSGGARSLATRLAARGPLAAYSLGPAGPFPEWELADLPPGAELWLESVLDVRGREDLRIPGPYDEKRRADKDAALMAAGLPTVGPGEPEAFRAWLRRVWEVGTEVDDRVPLDAAQDDRRSGAIDEYGYELALAAIVADEPADVDAWAHLGNLAFETSADELIPKTDQRRLLQDALVSYQCAVIAAEFTLPDPCSGLISTRAVENRPFGRALHGLLLTWWRLGEFELALRTAANLIWVSPDRTLGADEILNQLLLREPWTRDA